MMQKRFISLLVSAGTLIVAFILTILLCVQYVSGNEHLLARLLVATTVLFYCLVTLYFSAFEKTRGIGSLLNIILYFFLAVFAGLFWSINTPFSLLMFAFTILVSAILLGSKSLIFTSAASSIALFSIQTVHAHNFIQPDTEALAASATYGDAAAHSAVFIIFAILGWLAARQIELAFAKLKMSENALKNEKASLKEKLAKEKSKLLQAQRVEMAQLYRFTELGRKTSSVLHDLANQFAILSIDLGEPTKNKSITRAKESINEIEELIQKVFYAAGHAVLQQFSVKPILQQVVLETTEIAESNNIQFKIDIDEATLSGDKELFTIIIKSIVSNAIEAFSTSKLKAKRYIKISCKRKENTVRVGITDNANTLSNAVLLKLFSQTITTKQNGHGIGLFMAKSVIKNHFKGDLRAVNRPQTSFIISIPVR